MKNFRLNNSSLHAIMPKALPTAIAWDFVCNSLKEVQLISNSCVLTQRLGGHVYCDMTAFSSPAPYRKYRFDFHLNIIKKGDILRSVLSQAASRNYPTSIHKIFLSSMVSAMMTAGMMPVVTVPGSSCNPAATVITHTIPVRIHITAAALTIAVTDAIIYMMASASAVMRTRSAVVPHTVSVRVHIAVPAPAIVFCQSTVVAHTVSVCIRIAVPGPFPMYGSGYRCTTNNKRHCQRRSHRHHFVHRHYLHSTLRPCRDNKSPSHLFTFSLSHLSRFNNHFRHNFYFSFYFTESLSKASAVMTSPSAV